MTTGRTGLLPLLVFLLFLALSPGCLSTSLGPVTYDGKTLLVQVTDRDGPEDAALQVSVYRVEDFRQVEVTREILPVRLEEGLNTLAVPLELEKGTYRLYLYIIIDNARRASVIRDISVEDHGPAPRLGTG